MRPLEVRLPLWPAPPSETGKVVCPTHGAIWAYPQRGYLCHCLMPREEWARRLNEFAQEKR